LPRRGVRVAAGALAAAGLGVAGWAPPALAASAWCPRRFRRPQRAARLAAAAPPRCPRRLLPWWGGRLPRRDVRGTAASAWSPRRRCPRRRLPWCGGRLPQRGAGSPCGGACARGVLVAADVCVVWWPPPALAASAWCPRRLRRPRRAARLATAVPAGSPRRLWPWCGGRLPRRGVRGAAASAWSPFRRSLCAAPSSPPTSAWWWCPCRRCRLRRVGSLPQRGVRAAAAPVWSPRRRSLCCPRRLLPWCGGRLLRRGVRGAVASSWCLRRRCLFVVSSSPSASAWWRCRLRRVGALPLRDVRLAAVWCLRRRCLSVRPRRRGFSVEPSAAPTSAGWCPRRRSRLQRVGALPLFVACFAAASAWRPLRRSLRVVTSAPPTSSWWWCPRRRSRPQRGGSLVLRLGTCRSPSPLPPAWYATSAWRPRRQPGAPWR
jgi:hypothetical protein